MSAHEQKVHVILPVFNRLPLTLQFIESLKKQTHPHVHLLLIDDGSTDGSADAVKSQFANTTVLTGDGNLWWGGSLQLAHEWLKARPELKKDFILIQNNDTSLPEDFIQRGIQLVSNHPRSFYCAIGKDIRGTDKADSAGYYYDFEHADFHETFEQSKINCMSTRGLMAKVHDFIAVGGFRPKRLPHYLSDLEFTFRAKEFGFILATDKNFFCLIDFDTTGIKDFGKVKFGPMLKGLFSIRHAGNPIYWTNFLLMTSPPQYLFKNIFKVWLGVFNMVVLRRFLPGLVTKTRHLITGK